MNWVSKIRNRIGDSIFQQKLSKLHRKVKAVNLKEAITVGIIYDASTEDACNSVRALVKALKDEKKKVKALGYVDGKITQSYHLAKLELDFFSREDLNWYLHSKSAVIDNFINEKFDILLDLTFDNCKPAYYIAGLSKASFKVGKLSPLNKNSHDFLLDIHQSNDNMNYFINQIQYYLQLMNTYSHV